MWKFYNIRQQILQLRIYQNICDVKTTLLLKYQYYGKCLLESGIRVCVNINGLPVNQEGKLWRMPSAFVQNFQSEFEKGWCIRVTFSCADVKLWLMGEKLRLKIHKFHYPHDQ